MLVAATKREAKRREDAAEEIYGLMEESRKERDHLRALDFCGQLLNAEGYLFTTFVDKRLDTL